MCIPFQRVFWQNSAFNTNYQCELSVFFHLERTFRQGPGCSKGGQHSSLDINHYPADNAIGFRPTYRLDSDLSGGYRGYYMAARRYEISLRVFLLFII